jgi:phosphoglycolate phosphatase-like HAD superfamily hydrolase
MTVVFDLDYTLMDTARFKDALASSLAECGVSPESFWETYELTSKTAEKVCDYEPERHLLALATSLTCPKEEALRRIGAVVARGVDFLFAGAVPMLERLRSEGHRLVLFTHVNAAWQERKVKGAGLAGLFDRMMFAPENKERYVEELRTLAPPLVFVNDHGGEIDILQTAMPEARFVAVRGPKHLPSDRTVIVCEDMASVYKAIVAG